MGTDGNITGRAIKRVKDIIDRNTPEEYEFHNFNHTLRVVNAALEIGKAYKLSGDELEILQLAAWFHDTGYADKYKGHEDKSKEYAKGFLESEDYPEGKKKQVLACIEATRMPQNPNNLLEKIICDADLIHLGKKSFFKRNEKLRKEWIASQDFQSTDEEWYYKNIDFLENHVYHTSYVQNEYGLRKEKNIRRLKQLFKDSKRTEKSKISDTINIGIKKRNKTQPPGRGIETMFRNSLRGHLQLSGLADNKANIMLSINAIIISIVLSSLLPNFSSNPDLVIPTAILLAVCLLTIIFATMSTIPKVSQGTFTKKDIENRTTNLLFFGNFHDMQLEDFQWGMQEMMEDKDFLYGSMIKDFYYLGKVLNRKYMYLRICYRVFMFGLIIAVFSFVLFLF